MKASEIVVGGIYSNGNGNKKRVRKVIGEGAKFKVYDWQTDSDCVQYDVVTDGTFRDFKKGTRGNMTRVAFARWAKERVG